MKKNTKILIIVISILLVVLVGIVFLVISTSNNKNENNTTNIIHSNTQNNEKNKNEEDFTINEYTSQNEKKYGDKIKYVSKYEKRTNKKLDWRLFYEDSQYAYLIADNVIEGVSLFDYVDNYEDIESMSKEGKQLNSMLFQTDAGKDRKVEWTVSLQATAWMTDTKKWKELLDEDGKATFAIASPTLELYVNSYNSSKETDECDDDEKISLEYSEEYGGYDVNGKIEENYRNGIYSKGNFWLASPIPTKEVPAGKMKDSERVALIEDNSLTGKNIKSQGEFNVEKQESYYIDNPIRPVVCILKNKITSDMYINEEKENNDKANKVINEFIDAFNEKDIEKIKNTINENIYYSIMNLNKKDGEEPRVLWDKMAAIENLIEKNDKQIYNENDIYENLEEHFENYLEYKDKELSINEIQEVERVEDYLCIYKCQVDMEDDNEYIFVLAKLYDEFRIIGIKVNLN